MRRRADCCGGPPASNREQRDGRDQILNRVLPPPLSALAAVALLLAACTPTVKVEAPKEPITINLNIKLDADVRLRVEEKAKEDVKSKSIF